MHLAASKDSLNDSSILFSGSPLENEFQHFQKSARPIDLKSYDLQLALERAGKDTAATSRIKSEMAILDKNRIKLIHQYQKNTPVPSSLLLN